VLNYDAISPLFLCPTATDILATLFLPSCKRRAYGGAGWNGLLGACRTGAQRSASLPAVPSRLNVRCASAAVLQAAYRSADRRDGEQARANAEPAGRRRWQLLKNWAGRRQRRPSLSPYYLWSQEHHGTHYAPRAFCCASHAYLPCALIQFFSRLSLFLLGGLAGIVRMAACCATLLGMVPATGARGGRAWCIHGGYAHAALAHYYNADFSLHFTDDISMPTIDSRLAVLACAAGRTALATGAWWYLCAQAVSGAWRRGGLAKNLSAALPTATYSFLTTSHAPTADWQHSAAARGGDYSSTLAAALGRVGLCALAAAAKREGDGGATPRCPAAAHAPLALDWALHSAALFLRWDYGCRRRGRRKKATLFCPLLTIWTLDTM